MGIEEMLLGYTINGAKQLGIEKTKGSIEVGKDADFISSLQSMMASVTTSRRTYIPVE